MWGSGVSSCKYVVDCILTFLQSGIALEHNRGLDFSPGGLIKIALVESCSACLYRNEDFFHCGLFPKPTWDHWVPEWPVSKYQVSHWKVSPKPHVPRFIFLYTFQLNKSTVNISCWYGPIKVNLFALHVRNTFTLNETCQGKLLELYLLIFVCRFQSHHSSLIIPIWWATDMDQVCVRCPKPACLKSIAW